MLVNYITAVWSQWIGDPNSVRSYLHRKGYQTSAELESLL